MKVGSCRSSEKGRESDGFVLCSPFVRSGASFKVAKPGKKITGIELVMIEYIAWIRQSQTQTTQLISSYSTIIMNYKEVTIIFKITKSEGNMTDIFNATSVWSYRC